jgi:hypothetical protein
VDRPTSQWQTKAFVGSWVILSQTMRGEESFKVYSSDSINKSFIILPREADEANLAAAPDVLQVEEHGDMCCVHNHIGANAPHLPVQGGPKTVVNFRSPR